MLLYDHDHILVVGVALWFLSCCGASPFPCLLSAGVYNLWCCGSSSQGGIGDAVAAAVSECRDITVKKLAVREVPRSGKPAELLERYGISASCIVKAVNQILSAWLNTQLLLGHLCFSVRYLDILPAFTCIVKIFAEVWFYRTPFLNVVCFSIYIKLLLTVKTLCCCAKTIVQRWLEDKWTLTKYRFDWIDFCDPYEICWILFPVRSQAI